jgi:DHA1 family multidrug resistance protein-like MFS transporter
MTIIKQRNSWLTKEFFLGALNRDLQIIFLSNMVLSFGDGLYFYVWPLYIRDLGGTPGDVGILYSILGLASALTPLIGGFLADKYDRKKLMILGFLIWVPVPLMFSLVTNWSQLILPSFLYGCFISGPAASAYVATAARKEKMAITFTTISASWSLGYIFAPGIGSYLATIIGMKPVFYIAFILFAFATATLFFIRSQHATTHSLKSPKPSISFNPKRIFAWALFFAAIFFMITLFRPCIPQFIKYVYGPIYGYSDFHVGIFGSITFFGSFVFAIGLGKVGDKWKKTTAILIALIISVASIGLLISFGDFVILAFSSYLIGASYVIWSLMGALIGSLAPETSRGRWMSVAQTAALLAAFPSPYIGGILYEASPYNPFLIVIAATPLLAILALIIALKKEA